jgi:hypothetical protein
MLRWKKPGKSRQRKRYTHWRRNIGYSSVLTSWVSSEMHLAFALVFLGSAEYLFAGIDLPGLGFIETQTMHSKGETL